MLRVLHQNEVFFPLVKVSLILTNPPLVRAPGQRRIPLELLLQCTLVDESSTNLNIKFKAITSPFSDV